MMCRGGQDAIQDAVYFLVDFTAVFLNVVLNTVSIILITDLILGITIVVAGFLGLLIIYFSSSKIAARSRDEVLAENELNAHLTRSWDNIILGNQLFFDRWKIRFEELFQRTEEASLQVVKKKDLAVSIAALVTNGLVLGCALVLAWMHQETAGVVLSILVMLPRSLQIVIHIQYIHTYFAKWESLKEKLNVTLESLAKLDPIDLTPHIKHEDVLVRINDKLYPCKDIKAVMDKLTAGRITVTGPNGAGKSCLLLDLKNRYDILATYLPAQHQLMLSDDRISYSSGEVALAALKDIQFENSGILLLDEWDANLSNENRIILDRVIDKLSEHKLVVEIRHSMSSPHSILKSHE